MRKGIARIVCSAALSGLLVASAGAGHARQVVVCEPAGVAVACVAGPEHGIVVAVFTTNGNTYGAVWYCDESGNHLIHQHGPKSTGDDMHMRMIPKRCIVGG